MERQCVISEMTACLEGVGWGGVNKVCTCVHPCMFGTGVGSVWRGRACVRPRVFSLSFRKAEKGVSLLFSQRVRETNGVKQAELLVFQRQQGERNNKKASTHGWISATSQTESARNTQVFRLSLLLSFVTLALGLCTHAIHISYTF